VAWKTLWSSRVRRGEVLDIRDAPVLETDRATQKKIGEYEGGETGLSPDELISIIVLLRAYKRHFMACVSRKELIQEDDLRPHFERLRCGTDPEKIQEIHLLREIDDEALLMDVMIEGEQGRKERSGVTFALSDESKPVKLAALDAIHHVVSYKFNAEKSSWTLSDDGVKSLKAIIEETGSGGESKEYFTPLDQAFSLLSDSNTDSTREALLSLLDNPDTGIRAKAIEGLSEGSSYDGFTFWDFECSESAAYTYSKVLGKRNSPSGEVRSAVASFIDAQLSYESVPYLLELAEDEDSEVRKKAVSSLARLDFTVLDKPITPKGYGEDCDRREVIDVTVAHNSYWRDRVSRQLKSDDWKQRVDAIGLSQYIYSHERTTISLDHVNDESHEVRAKVMEVLGKRNPILPEIKRRQMDALVNGLNDPKVLVRVMAAVSLGELKEDSVLPHLGKALDDPDPMVAGNAAIAIAVFKKSRGGEVADMVLSDPDERVRWGALMSSSHEISENNAALYLDVMEKSPEPKVRRAAYNQLFAMMHDDQFAIDPECWTPDWGPVGYLGCAIQGLADSDRVIQRMAYYVYKRSYWDRGLAGLEEDLDSAEGEWKKTTKKAVTHFKSLEKRYGYLEPYELLNTEPKPISGIWNPFKGRVDNLMGSEIYPPMYEDDKLPQERLFYARDKSLDEPIDYSDNTPEDGEDEDIPF